MCHLILERLHGIAADIEARFRVPAGGERPTDPRWTELRLVPLAPQTLERLEAITTKVRERSGVNRAESAKEVVFCKTAIWSMRETSSGDR
jgi:hypothetical protein